MNTQEINESSTESPKHPYPQPSLPPPRQSSETITMRQSSPHGGVILPPPLSRSQSQSQSPRQSLTLPSLSTLSPLMSSPNKSTPTISTSLSNLVHDHHEQRGEPSFRRDSQLSPRAKARRQSMETSRAGFPFETIDEHPIYHDHDRHHQQGQQGRNQRRPRRSMPATSERPYQHPAYQYQEAGPSSLPPIPRFPSTDWTSQRPTRPSVEVNPRSRLSMSIPNPAPPGGAWFTIDETPQRNQVGWSQAQVDIYNAGWGDALRAVEAGSIGVGGQQYPRPQLIVRELRPHQPPPLRQSSSSDPGPPNYPAPYDQHPRSNSFGSTYPSPLTQSQTQHRHHPYAYQPTNGSGNSSRPSSSYAPWPHPPLERHSYSSTSTSQSPTSPHEGGSKGSRQAISCFPCRGRKLKCNGQKPCAQCTRRGGEDECHYAATIKRRGKGRKKSKSEDEDDESGGSEEGTEIAAEERMGE